MAITKKTLKNEHGEASFFEEASALVSELTETEPTTEEEIVDRYLQLALIVAKLKENPAFKALEDAEKRLRSTAEMIEQDVADSLKLIGEDVAGKEITMKGTRGHVVFSARKNVRTVKDNGALLLVMGEENFLANASVPLGKIDKYLTKEEQDQVLETTQTGARVMTPVHTLKDGE